MFKVRKWMLFVSVAVVMCIAVSQYFHYPVPQSSISSLSSSGTNGKVLHAKKNVSKQNMAEVILKESPTATNGDSGTLATIGGIWHGNYTTKDDTGKKPVGLWRILNHSYVEEHLDRPQIGDYICKDALCSNFLTERDLKQVDKCVTNFLKRQQVIEVRQTLVPTCHFKTQASNMALISFPGSGNTWTRKLLEKATGICTGEEHNSHS